MCQGRNVRMCRGNSAQTFQGRNVKMCQGSSAQTCQGRWQDRSATMFPGRCATACQERFATTFQGSSVPMFQGNSVPMFQDSSATTSLVSSAETSHLKSATTCQEKFATMCLASSASKFPSRCVTLPSQPTAESRLRGLKKTRNRSAESGGRITRGNKKRHLNNFINVTWLVSAIIFISTLQYLWHSSQTKGIKSSQ